MECLSESATKDLVNLLVNRGYFHTNVAPELASEDNTKSESKYSETDDACQVVSTHDGVVITKDVLQERLMQVLSTAGGRLRTEDASTLLAVDSRHVEHICRNTDTILQVRDDLIIELYMDRMAEITNLQLVENNGRVVVSDLATAVWGMPFDLVINALQQRIANGTIQASLLTLSSLKVLVTSAFEEREKCRIEGAFKAITLPTMVNSVCHDFEWDIEYVLPILKEQINTGVVLGELHDSGGSLSGAMYIPKVYLDKQRTSIDEFFRSNGYITSQECLAMGVLESRMGDYVQETNPSAIVLSNSVILKEVVVTPIEQALLETIASESFLDLRLHLPDAIMQYEDDVRTIVKEMALPKDEMGCALFSEGEALFVTQGMIRHMTKTLLPPLIESFAKTRAKELKSSNALNDGKGGESPVIQSPKRKGRKSSKKSKAATASTSSNETIRYGVVPLVTVANAVASEYPDLMDIQTAVAPLVDEKDNNAPLWEQAEDEAKVGDGPLYELCRSVLYEDSFQSSCELAIRAELERLDSISHSSSVRSRKDGATRMRSIESAFEDPACFGAACFAVQAHAKFLQYAQTVPDVDEEIILALKEDYLAGCCSDFTARLTEYCLFRNEIDDQVFIIVERNKDGTAIDAAESDLPEYCQSVDSTARRYPSTKLVCVESTDSGETKLPLPTLRVVLSGGIGIQLSRAWTLCGGRCYEGGIKVNDDGSETIRQGGPDGFLSHMEDNCLTICGLPFKKLDKKSEKQYLFSRRKALTEQLEARNEPNEVLELTIMLLFQQVKSLVVTGPLLAGPILVLLGKERKISENVSKLLQELANAVNGGSKPAGTLVTAVKACGLSRDISKHTVPGNDV